MINPEQPTMIFKRSWDEFLKSGLLWWINRTLVLFGWVIVLEVPLDANGAEVGSVNRAYPARTRFRGFTDGEDPQFTQLTRHLYDEAPRLWHQVNDAYELDGLDTQEHKEG